VAVRQPIAGQVRLEGKLARFAQGVLELETQAGQLVHVPLDQVQKANLKFEW
jgi:ribosome maturation factor RimP